MVQSRMPGYETWSEFKKKFKANYWNKYVQQNVRRIREILIIGNIIIKGPLKTV